MTYKICLVLLERGALTYDYVKTYHDAGRITDEQFDELVAKLNEEE